MNSELASLKECFAKVEKILGEHNATQKSKVIDQTLFDDTASNSYCEARARIDMLSQLAGNKEIRNSGRSLFSMYTSEEESFKPRLAREEGDFIIEHVKVSVHHEKTGGNGDIHDAQK